MRTRILESLFDPMRMSPFFAATIAIGFETSFIVPITLWQRRTGHTRCSVGGDSVRQDGCRTPWSLQVVVGGVAFDALSSAGLDDCHVVFVVHCDVCPLIRPVGRQLRWGEHKEASY